MAKSSDNTGTEQGSGEANKPSPLLIAALGDHAGTLGLVQAEGETEIEFAVRAIEALGAALTGLAEEASRLREELKGANRRLASQRGATTKAKARIVELEEAGKPRKLGPMAALFDDEAEAFTVDDLLTAIDGADELVLAFSDGRDELKGIKPRQVRADAFRLTRGRVHFIDEPLLVTGPGEPETVSHLAGVALLVDGEQVAWSALAQPLDIGAGQTVNLAGSVIFG